MPSYSPSDFLKKLRSLKQQTSSKRALHHHSTATGVLVVSGPVLACGSFQPPRQEQTVISAIYRNTSDAAQTFLPPVQAVADMIPGVGGIIKGAIGGILSSLQLVDVSQFPGFLVLSRLIPSLATIEIYPEQGGLGDAHSPIVPALPSYRQCTDRSHRG